MRKINTDNTTVNNAGSLFLCHTLRHLSANHILAAELLNNNEYGVALCYQGNGLLDSIQGKRHTDEIWLCKPS